MGIGEKVTAVGGEDGMGVHFRYCEKEVTDATLGNGKGKGAAETIGAGKGGNGVF